MWTFVFTSIVVCCHIISLDPTCHMNFCLYIHCGLLSYYLTWPNVSCELLSLHPLWSVVILPHLIQRVMWTFVFTSIVVCCHITSLDPTCHVNFCLYIHCGLLSYYLTWSNVSCELLSLHPLWSVVILPHLTQRVMWTFVFTSIVVCCHITSLDPTCHMNFCLYIHCGLLSYYLTWPNVSCELLSLHPFWSVVILPHLTQCVMWIFVFTSTVVCNVSHFNLLLQSHWVLLLNLNVK
jgi:hypothetical protein